LWSHAFDARNFNGKGLSRTQRQQKLRAEIIPECLVPQPIEHQIYVTRGRMVLLDADPAALY
jgi:hypothetical protein